MAFNDSVVGGGGELIRDNIHSRGYSPGVSGWRIDRDGNAEFNGVTVRGDLILGTFPAGPYIWGHADGGVPAIEFNDGVHGGKVRLLVDDSQPSAAAMFIGGEPGVSASFARHTVNQTQAGMDVQTDAGELLIVVADGNNHECVLYAQAPAGPPISVTASNQRTTPDGTLGRVETQGELLVERFKADSNYPNRVSKGKARQSAVDTNSSSTANVNISSANIQNVYVEQGWAYRATYRLQCRSTVAGDRVAFRLWNGSVGGTQLSATWLADMGPSTGSPVDFLISFLWGAGATETIANLNLSVARFSGSGTVTVSINSGFEATVEKIGIASRISSSL